MEWVCIGIIVFFYVVYFVPLPVNYLIKFLIMGKKKFRDTKFAGLINKIASNKIVRGTLKITGIGSPLVEGARNLTTPTGEEKPHKSTKIQWYVVLVLLAVLVYLDIIPKEILLGWII